jgi:L1 cell adhesion molecule like protein
MIKAAEKFKDDDEKERQRIEAKNSLENYVYSTRNTLQDSKEEKAKEAWAEAEPIVKDAIKWLEENDRETKDVYEQKQKELEDKLRPIVMKLYQAPAPANDTDGPTDGPKVEDVD